MVEAEYVNQGCYKAVVNKIVHLYLGEQFCFKRLQ
jgi:hypothetical protein